MNKPYALVALAALLLAGCATNYYQQFYTENTNIHPAAKAALLPYSGNTEVYSTNDQDKDGRELNRRGYMVIGWSSFQGGGAVTKEQLIELAKKVGADVVLNKSAYQGSSQETMPLLQYNPGQTSTTYQQGTVNANAYSNTGRSAYGTANYSGTSTTTSPGTFSTNYVPVTVHRYEHVATFWRKSKPPVLGCMVTPLPDEVRQKIRRNTGGYIADVMDNSPAFRANLMVGDILTAVDDTPILTADDFFTTMDAKQGQKVKLTIERDGKPVVVDVQLNRRS
jgi:outer membrane lipoprotein SlyB